MADDKYTTEHVAGSANSGEDAGVPAQKKTFMQKYKEHLRKWWWVHFLIIAAGALIIILPLIYVGVPNIVQSELNKSTIGVDQESITDPQENSVYVKINATAHSGSIFHPDIAPFNASLYNIEAYGYPFGQLQVPSIHVQKNIPITIDQRLEVTDMLQFINYNKKILTSEEFSYGIRQNPIKVHQPGLQTVDASYDHHITQKGLNSFKGFEIRNPKATLSSDGTAVLNGTAYVPNASGLTLEFGTILFNVALPNGTIVGNATLENFTLQPSGSEHPTVAYANAAAILAAQDKSTGDVEVHITGNTIKNNNGQRITYFEKALEGTTLITKINVNKALAADSGSS